MSQETGTGKYFVILERCKGLEPVPTAVVHPCEKSALAGAIEARELGLIEPILVGPAGKIDVVAKAAGLERCSLEQNRPLQLASQNMLGISETHAEPV